MDKTTPIEWQPAIDSATRSRAVQAAQGNCAFDVLLAGGQLIDVITGEIRAALIELLESPDKREDLRKRALDRARQFSWDRTARAVLDRLADAHA